MNDSGTCKYNFCPGFTKSNSLMSVFSGRSDEFIRIVNGVYGKHNFVIEGETRIGKTFFIEFLEDCTNGAIDDYLDDMIDEDIVSNIHQLKDKLNRLLFINISLHSINDYSSFLATTLEKIFAAFGVKSPFGYSQAISTRNFLIFLKDKIIPIIDNKTIVLMYDEFERITDSGYKGKKKELLGCLSQIIQSYPNIRLMVVGWNGMERRIRQENIGSVSDFFDQFARRRLLSPLSVESTSLLVKKIGSSVFNATIPTSIIDRSIFFTGCRPFYAHKYFDLMFEEVVVVKNYELNAFQDKQNCRKIVEEPILRDAELTIKSAIQPEGIKSSVLTTIARIPDCSVASLNTIINDDQLENCLDDLKHYSIITSHRNIYRINGELYRKWILKFLRNTFVNQQRSAPVIKTEEKFRTFIESLIIQFKHLVEQKKGYKLLWKSSKPALEEDSQILFDILFEKFAGASGIFLNREVETGRGPVDFKFTGGFEFCAHLEIKRANSSKLKHGLEKQLPTYLKADEVKYGFYLIIAYNSKDLKKANELAKESLTLGDTKNIHLKAYVVDARSKVSASKTK